MATNPTLLTTPIAENGTKNVIPAVQAAAGDGLLSQSTGFPAETSLPLGAGGKAPQREDFNGVLYLLSNLAYYNQKGWFFQFDANQDYFASCVVRDTTDGQLYEAINDVAAGGSVPSADNTNWKKFFPVGKVIGEIFPYAGTSQPPGALLCNGAAVSRTMYPDLFAEIGVTYGSGDGSTTFNLPNLVAKFIEGDLTSGTVKSAGLPNITGYAGKPYHGNEFPTDGPVDVSGAFSSANVGVNAVRAADGAAGTSTARFSLSFDASASNPIYGNSDTVQPPALTMRYYIQAFTDSTDPALVNLTQIVQDLANKLTREQTPAFNKRDVVTVSGTYTAPVTGWYKITVKGGGGGGKGSSHSGTTYLSGGSGGGEGGMSIGFEKMTAGDIVAVVVGAGGAGGAAGGSGGGNGGDTTATVNLTTYTGGGGQGASSVYRGGTGGTGDIPGAPGGAPTGYNGTYGNIGGAGASGGGNGGGNGSSAGVKGGGGGGGSVSTAGNNEAGGKGGDGYAWFELFDPSLM